MNSGFYRNTIGLNRNRKVAHELVLWWHYEPKKSAIYAKILNYINFSCIVFCVKISWFSYYIYCLQEEPNHFGLRVSTHFGLEVLEQFDIENHKRRIGNIEKYFLNNTNFSWLIFYNKRWQNPHFTYYQTIYLLTNPIFCHYPP